MSGGSQIEGSVSAATGHATGSTIVPEYTERRMTFYPVTPREMRDLSFISAAALAFSAIGSFCLSQAFSLYTGAVFAEPGKVTAQGHVLKDFGAPGCLILAIIFYILAGIALYVRSRNIDDIKAESKAVKATVRISADGKPEQN